MPVQLHGRRGWQRFIRARQAGLRGQPGERRGGGAMLCNGSPFERPTAFDVGGRAANIECWGAHAFEWRTVASIAPPPRLSLVLGAEGPGLPPALMNRCRRVSIPMSPGIDSLNVATAGAIALAHVFSRRTD